MKYLDGNYYVEVKDHRYKIQPTENKIIRKREPPISLRTQYQVQNEAQMRKNKKVIKNDNDELIVKNYNEKEQPKKQQPNFKPPNRPSCRRNNWVEFDKGWYCQNCGYIMNKQKHQIDKKILREDHYFSTRLPYADKSIREIWINMVTTTNNSTEDMIDNLQELKGKTKLKNYKIIGNYYIEMKKRNFKFEENPFAKNAQGFRKILS